MGNPVLILVNARWLDSWKSNQIWARLLAFRMSAAKTGHSVPVSWHVEIELGHSFVP